MKHLFQAFHHLVNRFFSGGSAGCDSNELLTFYPVRPDFIGGLYMVCLCQLRTKLRKTVGIGAGAPANYQHQVGTVGQFQGGYLSFADIVADGINNMYLGVFGKGDINDFLGEFGEIIRYLGGL